MAARILDDVLNNYLNVDSLIDWLSDDKPLNDHNVVFKNYDSSPIQFVSYFITYLREQSSRNFQVYDAETPRKSSSCRNLKNMKIATEKSSLTTKSDLNLSLAVDLDLESLQSFPSLSSCSSLKMGSGEKIACSLTSFNVGLDESNTKDVPDKRTTRVKLFSEAVEGTQKGINDSKKKDVDIWDEPDSNIINKFAISTPKFAFKSTALHSGDYFNFPEVEEEKLKSTNKSDWIGYSAGGSSPDPSSVTVAKSKSFSGSLCQKNKDNKMSLKMSLGDFILNDMNSSDCKKDRKHKVKKRISPLRISGNEKYHGEKPDNSHLSCLEEEENSTINVSSDARNVAMSATEKINTIMNNSEKALSEDNRQMLKGRQPVPESASHINELRILSKIYSYLIGENYCQNIMIELCFIFSLLVIEDSDKKTFESGSAIAEGKIFGSIDNCVYFAVETLWLQKSCLLHLNLSALKLLSENERIEKFNKNLKEFLMNAYTRNQSVEEFKKNRSLVKTGMQGNVSFQYETDNRENFTSNISFHSFKKQRDLFYNILAIWEANHSTSGWIFSVGLGSKIRSLLAISSDPINLLHLARLFRNQMITSCCGENQSEGDLNEEILELLPTADPNKILRLRARLTSSPKRQGPCPLPDFTGHQEFYKEFILHASNSVFHQHLKNSLCDEILRLNDADLIGDSEDEESSLDELAEERYIQCFNILTLLAKFLGFLEFLPYRGEKGFSERISNIHCSVRTYVLPLFDLTSCLQSAVKKRKLILTIPWIVSYLSMIDPYSARLKIYQNVWRLLIVVYKTLKALRNERNRFYLKLTLGWIFQLPNFPSDQFYSVLDDYKKSLGENQRSGFLTCSEEQSLTGLDTRIFIPDSVLYTVCPYLNEINVILSENSGCNVRHIRPVTTQENSFTKSQTSKQLQLRLEGNFLHNQSSSTRKTVEFVTERVASIIIKHLIYKTIPKMKENFREKLDELSTFDVREAKSAAEALSERCYKELLSLCHEENLEISLKKSEVAMKCLLSNDLQPSVAGTCTKIAARQAMEKVEGWMQSHVTLAMVKKEFVSTIRKKSGKRVAETNAGPADSTDLRLGNSTARGLREVGAGGTGAVDEDGESAWPASQTIKATKEWICEIREAEGDVSSAKLELLVDEAIKTVRFRNDVIPAAEKAVSSLVLDLVIMFCVHSKGDDVRLLFRKFVVLLSCVGVESRSNLERIICSRNLAIISKESKCRERTWENLGKLLFLLLEKNFLDRENLEAQLLSIFLHPYEKEEGDIYVKFLSSFFDSYTKIYGSDKLSLLLEYMIETINDDESKSDDFT